MHCIITLQFLTTLAGPISCLLLWFNHKIAQVVCELTTMVSVLVCVFYKSNLSIILALSSFFLSRNVQGPKRNPQQHKHITGLPLASCVQDMKSKLSFISSALRTKAFTTKQDSCKNAQCYQKRLKCHEQCSPVLLKGAAVLSALMCYALAPNTTSNAFYKINPIGSGLHANNESHITTLTTF